MLLLRDAGREKIELRFIKPLVLALCRKCPGAWATAAMDWCNDECDDIWANSDYSVGCVGRSSRGARCIPSRESVAVAKVGRDDSGYPKVMGGLDGMGGWVVVVVVVLI